MTLEDSRDKHALRHTSVAGYTPYASFWPRGALARSAPQVVGGSETRLPRGFGVRPGCTVPFPTLGFGAWSTEVSEPSRSPPPPRRAPVPFRRPYRIRCRVISDRPGLTGDVLPSVGVGRQLAQRGHEVVLVASDHFRPLAERSNFEFVGLGSDADYRRIIQDPALFDRRRGLETVLRQTVESLEMVYTAVQRCIVPGRTLVAAHVLDFASRMLQERGEVPVATLLLSQALLRSQYQVPTLVGTLNLSRWPRWTKRLFWWTVDRLVIDRIVLSELDGLRARHALGPIRRPFDGWILSPRLTVGLFPTGLRPAAPDWPPGASHQLPTLR